MSQPASNVTIHASQFPENVRRDLLESLRTRRVNHKFHYDSVKQTQKWLALHQAYSPTRNDADCRAIYDKSFCGGRGENQGEAGSRHRPRLRRRAKGHAAAEIAESRAARKFSTRRAMSARRWFWSRGKPRWPLCRRKIVFPFVCDLATADDLPTFARVTPSRRVTCHLFRHDSEFRAAGNSAEARVADSPEGFSAVQRQSCARQRLRRRREKNSAAIRQRR